MRGVQRAIKFWVSAWSLHLEQGHCITRWVGLPAQVIHGIIQSSNNSSLASSVRGEAVWSQQQRDMEMLALLDQKR